MLPPLWQPPLWVWRTIRRSITIRITQQGFEVILYLVLGYLIFCEVWVFQKLNRVQLVNGLWKHFRQNANKLPHRVHRLFFTNCPCLFGPLPMLDIFHLMFFIYFLMFLLMFFLNLSMMWWLFMFSVQLRGVLPCL